MAGTVSPWSSLYSQNPRIHSSLLSGSSTLANRFEKTKISYEKALKHFKHYKCRIISVIILLVNMNLILTHNNVRPIKYITTICLGEIIIYCPAYRPELLSLPTLRSTIGPLGSVGEPESVQLNSQRAKPHSSIRVRGF